MARPLIAMTFTGDAEGTMKKIPDDKQVLDTVARYLKVY